LECPVEAHPEIGGINLFKGPGSSFATVLASGRLTKSPRRKRSLLEKKFPNGIIRRIVNIAATGAGADRPQPPGAGE
jgi:hypothetical protein